MTRSQRLKTYITLLLLLCFPASLLAFEVHYYETDALGTPITMVDVDGNRVWKAVYYPFGEERAIQETPESNYRRFIGKEKDKETGLTYFEARYMEANTGRFLSPDPVGPVDAFTGETNYVLLTQPQRLNRYAYGLNNPYRYVDPDGKFVGVAIAAVIAVATFADMANAPDIGDVTYPSQTTAGFAANVAATETVGFWGGKLLGRVFSKSVSKGGLRFEDFSKTDIGKIKAALNEAGISSDTDILIKGADMPKGYAGMTLGDEGFVVNKNLINDHGELVKTFRHELKHVFDRRALGNSSTYGQALEDAAKKVE